MTSFLLLARGLSGVLVCCFGKRSERQERVCDLVQWVECDELIVHECLAVIFNAGILGELFYPGLVVFI